MMAPRFAVLAATITLGCNAEKAPVATSPPPNRAAPVASASTAPVASVVEPDPPAPALDAVKKLADPDQAVRDAAAASLRNSIAKDPAASGDRGEAFWKAKLAALAPGITKKEFEAATGAKGEGTLGGGGGSTSNLRLDDYWSVVARFDRSGKLTEVGPPTRSARPVWVEPPPSFSGKWTTYYVNGFVAHDIQYKKGEYERFTSYYDNGKLTNEQRYIAGKIDGPELGFHRDGHKAYEIRHSAGKSVGRWVHWYPSGKQESEQSYVEGELDGSSIHWREDGTKSSRIDYRKGKETGQAAWDEQGKLLYARGSAENAEK